VADGETKIWIGREDAAVEIVTNPQGIKPGPCLGLNVSVGSPDPLRRRRKEAERADPLFTKGAKGRARSRILHLAADFGCWRLGGRAFSWWRRDG